MNYSDVDKPLFALTAREFVEMLEKHFGKTVQCAPDPPKKPESTGRLVYGLRGIADLFHCSHKTAQFYKDHVIREAVTQRGRKIVVDVDKALELFNRKKSDTKQNENA